MKNTNNIESPKMRHTQPRYYSSIKRNNHYYIAEVSTASGRVLKVFRFTKSETDFTDNFWEFCIDLIKENKKEDAARRKRFPLTTN